MTCNQICNRFWLLYDGSLYTISLPYPGKKNASITKNLNVTKQKKLSWMLHLFTFLQPQLELLPKMLPHSQSLLIQGQQYHQHICQPWNRECVEPAVGKINEGQGPLVALDCEAHSSLQRLLYELYSVSFGDIRKTFSHIMYTNLGYWWQFIEC